MFEFSTTINCHTVISIRPSETEHLELHNSHRNRQHLLSNLLKGVLRSGIVQLEVKGQRVTGKCV